VAADVGPVIVTAGAVLSDAAIVHVNAREAEPPVAVTVAVVAYVPAVVGVPAMRPVDAATATPGGRPVAL
jgi:hypothetical protein